MNDLRPRPRQTDLLLRHRFRPNNLLLIGVGGSDVNGQFEVPAGGHEKSPPLERELLLLRRKLNSSRSGFLHSK
jgi:hypothetical protein